ncbi:hypothetical protein MMC16_006557 [Acarospora aff. strigata]|nr:hypothetical protein [Acarospora aff. strigata]
MEFDSAPLPNATIPGQNSDLTSYQLASSNDSSRIWTAYGIDTPRPRNFNVYDFQGTGKLNAISNTWELLAWGEDSRGDGYLVIYETPVVATGGPAGLDIESRVEGGPSLETLGHIFKALTGLGNEELTKLVGEIGKVPRNGARENLAPVICDEDCRENVNQPS